MVALTALAVLIAFCAVFAAASLRREKPLSVGEEWPRNVAHRGASEVAPENTLAAFGRAREAGAGGLELDVHLSRDGHVVVIHDATLGRTTDGSGAVSERTLPELRSLDAGHHFTEPGDASGHSYRGREARIPTLVETLEEFPGMTVNLDIKEDTAGIEWAVLEDIDRAGARDRVLVASQKGGVISRFRKLSEISGDRVATAASRLEVARFYALSLLRLEGVADPPYDALQIPVEYGGAELATGRFVKAAHARGVRVDAWTINETQTMRRMLDLGVDSIMTDRPAELERVLERRTSGEG